MQHNNPYTTHASCTPLTRLLHATYTPQETSHIEHLMQQKKQLTQQKTHIQTSKIFNCKCVGVGQYRAPVSSTVWRWRGYRRAEVCSSSERCRLQVTLTRLLHASYTPLTRLLHVFSERCHLQVTCLFTFFHLISFQVSKRLQRK
jgi:hypothetical protein